MLKRLTKIVVYAAGVAVVLGLIAAGSLMVWVAQGPRSLQDLTPYIESALSAEDGSYRTEIKETWIKWGSWRHPLDIRIHDIKIVTREGKPFTSFPEIAVDISLWSLMTGEVLPTAITVNKPAFQLFQNTDRSVSLGFGEFDFSAETPQTEKPEEEAAPPTVDVAAIIALLSSSDSKLRKLRRVKVHEAKATIGSLKHGIVFSVHGVEVNAKRTRSGDIRIIAGGKMHINKRESSLGLELVVRDDAEVQADVLFDQIIPKELAALLPENEWEDVVDAPLGGKISFSLGKEGNIDSADFRITAGKGRITHKFLTKPLDIESLFIEGSLRNKGSDLVVRTAKTSIGKTTVEAQGNITLQEGAVEGVEAELSAKDISAADLPAFWPPSLAPLTREWVTENITEGRVPAAMVKLHIKPGDLEAPVLPREAVDAAILLENSTIRYLPEHPLITKLNGTIYIDGLSLNANITAADYMQASKLSSGNVVIDDLNADNPYIKVNFNATTTAKDAIHVLRLPRVEQAKRLNLMSGDSAEGTGTVQAALGFYFFAPTGPDGKPTEPDIDYTIVGDLKNFSVDGLLKKFDIRNGSGSLAIDKKKLEFRGNGNVNGANASQASVVYNFDDQEEYELLVDTTAVAPVSSMPKFGYPSMPFASGSFGVKASLKQNKDVELSTASLDLTETAINTLGWSKPVKEPASFDIKAEKKNGVLNVTEFTLKGKDADASGSATLNKDLTEIQTLSLKTAHVGGTVLDKVFYEKADGRVKLEVSGKSADLSDWWDNENSDNNFSFANFPAVEFKSAITTLTLSKQGSISNFKGEMRCTAKLCESADISGLIGDKKEFNMHILRNPKGKRILSLRALDAGAFLKAFGAYPNLQDGELSLSGVYDDAGKLKGRLIIDDFTVKKAPVLAKILSLASFTGVLDLMQGNGISFVKLVAPYSLKNDVITVSKGKAYGGSIGITASGTMTFPGQTLDVNGTVVPAYALNNIFGKIPLVGAILTGGDGGGVFAFNYTVKGTERNPDVSVNPLSVLAPGFLRNIFGGDDKEEE